MIFKKQIKSDFFLKFVIIQPCFRLKGSSESEFHFIGLWIEILLKNVFYCSEPVKAGVSFGQIFHVNIHQVESEEARPRGPGRALQRLEALQGNSAGASHELEEPGPHLLVVPPHDPPEPDHLGALGSAVLQASVRLPV